MSKTQPQLVRNLSLGATQPADRQRNSNCCPPKKSPISLIGLAWRFAAALMIDAAIFSLQLALVDETIENLGVEVDRFLGEVVILSWIFQLFPDLTSRELLAAIISALLIGSCIALWSLVMNDFRMFRGSIAHRVIAFFIVLCFCTAIATEWILIQTRVTFAMSSWFNTSASFNAGTALFLSLVFVVAANAAACLTSYLFHAIQTRNEVRS